MRSDTGAVRRVQLSGSLAEAAAGAALVIEAVIEVLAVKQSILREAMAVARPDALYGTNTSQLSITAIASASPGAADRVVGLHFFNPVVLMRLVEVVRGLLGQADEDQAIDNAEVHGS